MSRKNACACGRAVTNP